jgi:Bacterial Ig-like domain
VIIDSRGNTKPDMLWDGTRLYALTVPNDLGSTDQRALLRRYSYDTNTKTYTRDANFPVQVATGPMETIVLDKDTTGKLWVTFTQGSQVYVNHSLSSDTSWGTPFVLPVNGTSVSADDISAVVPFDTRTSAPKMGVMWSNQADNAMYFSTHTDGDATNVWSPTRMALGGPGYTDDHINLKSLEADASGRVFAAIKTSRNDVTTPNRDDPLIVVLVLGQDDVWRSHVFSTVRENQTKPMVMVDQVNRNLYVFATGSPGTIYYKRTSLDNIFFPSGQGTPFMRSDTSGLNNVTSTKQNITTSNGLATAGWLALAADSNRTYWHNSINFDTTAPAVDGVAPAEGATGVSRADNVEATFSEAMDPATLSTTTFTLTKQGSATPVAATVAYDEATKKATLDPSADLDPSATYTATLKGGASGAKDLAGSSLAADKTWSFTTQAALAAPSNLSAARSGSPSNQRIDLSWTDNSSSEANFVIERSTTSGFTSSLVTYRVPANATSYRDKALNMKTTYYYRVFAVDSTGTRSAPSNVASATTK